MNEVELAPFVEPLLGLVGAALLGVAVFVINWLRQKVGMEKLSKDAAIRGYLEDAIDKGIDHALLKLPDNEEDATNSATKMVVLYVMKSVPDALKHFGITEDHLTEMIEARLSKRFGAEEISENT